MAFQEWLSYEFTAPRTESVNIQLRWEETAVTFTVSTDALTNTLQDINKKEDKTTIDFQELAIRTLEKPPSQKEKALEYLELSFSLLDSIENEYYRKAYAFNYKVLKGELLQSMGKQKEETLLIEKAWDAAGGFNNFCYALRKYTVENKKSEALKILKEGLRRYPDNFQTHFAFVEYYLKENNQKKATEHF